MPRLRIATWNINWFNRGEEPTKRKLDYLAQQPWDVVCLQEIRTSTMRMIEAHGLADSWAFSASVPATRGFGALILARNGVALGPPMLLGDLPEPNWGVSARASLDGSDVTVLSWHAPNAARPEGRARKAAAYRAIDRWARERRGPVIVGADANHGAVWTRNRDYPGEPFNPIADDDWADENRFWAAPEHDLHDLWFTYLVRHPDLVARLRVERPDGPSAISYTRGSKARPQPDRFDYLLASPEVTVVEVAYHYEESVAAGSDHALVTATVDIP